MIYLPGNSEEATMQCKNCGERMVGDGYSQVIRCPNTPEDTDIMEPDAQGDYCKGDQEADSPTEGAE